jgi:CspA family cold shock protein
MYDRRPEFFREDTPPGRQVEAKIKWFNASKGFGFVTMSDGSQDAFLPMAILRRAGYEDVREGASITCEVSAGAKGPLVTNVLNIDSSTAVAPGAEHRPTRPATAMEGAVKWFEAEKGYGFISPDGGGGMCSSTSRCAAASTLGPGQRVSRCGRRQEGPRGRPNHADLSETAPA